jgi:hypothetical protein
METALLAIVIPQAVVLIGLLVTDVLTRRREVELRLSDRKQKLYADFVRAQINLNRSVKEETALKDEDTEVIARFSSNAWLVASDEVIQAFYEFQEFAQKHSGDLKSLPYLGRMLLELRKDMGNPRTQLSANEAVQSFVLVEDWDKVAELFA